MSLVLHSTYWDIDGAPGSQVLVATGPQVHTPAARGTCLPGVGCGTVQQAFTATSTGTAHLSAHRSTCGEALACRPDQRTYEVTIRVTG